MIRVLLVTSDREECGIREYGRMLMEAMKEVAPEIEISEWPHPQRDDVLSAWSMFKGRDHDILQLNHHAALHASWTPENLAELRNIYKVVVTQHDTLETFDLMKERGLPDFTGADALVVHEPVIGLSDLIVRGDDGLKHQERPVERVHYIRQGVLPAANGNYVPPPRPLLGTVGFPFPWKNYDLLCKAAGDAGWSVLLLAPGATDEQAAHWRELNPGVVVTQKFLQRSTVVAFLSVCTATAFFYSTGNTGTSGAIRLGLAARRPLLAFHCRQTRDLDQEEGILWCSTEGTIASALQALRTGYEAYYAGAIAEIAERDSWKNTAAKYAAIYHSLL